MRRPLPPLLALVFTLLAATASLAASEAQKKAASSLLDATEYERRIRMPFDIPSLGIPAIDLFISRMKEGAEFQLLKTRTSEAIPKIRSGLVEAYANRFSEHELASLAKFFMSPLGKKYVSLQPELQLAEAKLVIDEVLLKSNPKAIAELETLKQAEEALKQREMQAEAERLSLEAQATLGNRDAMYRLANVYCSSLGSPSDRMANRAKCFELKTRAAEAGLTDAQFDVGFSYVDGRYGNQKSGAEMFKWMKRAADQGHSSAQFYVGSAYAGNIRVYGNQPTGVEVNAKEAEFWLRKAAQAGGMGAIMDLASMYLEGRIVERNIPESIRFYSMAAEKKNNFAMRKLGEIYENGVDMPPNIPEAMKWYKLAAGVTR